MEYLNFINPNYTVCFSGHRPEGLPGNGDPENPELQKLIEILQKEIIKAISSGIIFFVHGCMAGFDIIAAEKILEIKKQHPQIKLVSVAPFAVHYFNKEKCWTPHWRNRAREVFRRQDFGISLAEHYRSGIYYERDRLIIDHSRELICYCKYNKSGTGNITSAPKSRNFSPEFSHRDCVKNTRNGLRISPFFSLPDEKIRATKFATFKCRSNTIEYAQKQGKSIKNLAEIIF